MRVVRHRGKWAAEFYRNGERKRPSTGLDATPENRDVAQRKADEIMRAVAEPVGDTMADIVRAYLDDSRAISIKRLEEAWKAARGYWADLTPEKITRHTCRGYIDQRTKAGRKPGTINKELWTLRAAVNWHNKLNSAQWEFLPQPPPRDRWLTPDEFKRLLNAARGAEHLSTFLHLAIATAGRKEAILQLTWLQVSWDRDEIWLGRKANGKPRARVPMTKTLRAVLQTALANQPRGDCNNIIQWGGKPVGDIKKAFRSAATNAKLKDVTIHDLRHTAAVWMVEAGVSLEKIAEYLGHTNLEITRRVYARFQPDHLRDAADAVEIR